ncbi:MAG TPA: YkgJ family cysteine cluster protein [Candidatus Nitrosotenuis sp.]|nr:YkgJ family cysteine cluster protein [Candidatus Nitrosotenuis sp.]
MEFRCVKDCSQCCIEREYFPSKRFGKVGVLVLPDEKSKIEELAKKHHLDVKIMPRIGISYHDLTKPERVLAYQMMGREQNGNTCPFLETGSQKRSPHGGYACKIYSDRPLACKAYPLIETEPLVLDSKCKFCKMCGTADSNLDGETESLIKIKTKMTTDAPIIWRYATGIGEIEDLRDVQEGWIRET